MHHLGSLHFSLQNGESVCICGAWCVCAHVYICVCVCVCMYTYTCINYIYQVSFRVTALLATHDESVCIFGARDVCVCMHTFVNVCMCVYMCAYTSTSYVYIISPLFPALLASEWWECGHIRRAWCFPPATPFVCHQWASAVLVSAHMWIIHAHTYIYECIYVCIYIYIHVYEYMYMNICIYTYIYM